MVAVGLRIVEPENGAAFTGEPTVTFRGTLTKRPHELAEVPLFYRWYSSLHLDATQERYAMNVTALTDPMTPFDAERLAMGSHVITFAASDRAGETDADFEAVQHGGVTGGLDGEGRCVIHVFRANIIEPTGGRVPRVGLTVVAEAPAFWAISDDGEPPYALNEDYQAYNRLRFRWRFEPNGAPTGRPVLEFTPAPEDFGFDPEEPPARVTYEPDLPATATGSYRIVLFVEDALDQGLAQESDDVTVILEG